MAKGVRLGAMGRWDGKRSRVGNWGLSGGLDLVESGVQLV